VYVSIISPSGHSYFHIDTVRMRPHHTLVETAIGALFTKSGTTNKVLCHPCDSG
jgi:hypothetical protein